MTSAGDLKLQLIEKPHPDLATYFDKRIEEFNVARWEVKEKFPIAVTLTNEHGEIVGGVSAKTFGIWLLIENLWIHEKLRSQGYGFKILTMLEQAAKKRGCEFALLDTLNFQARPFYEKYGYKLQWTQKCYPREGCKYFMVKEL